MLQITIRTIIQNCFKVLEVSTETKRLRAIEAFKTLNGLNLNFMKEIFYRPSNLSHKKDNLYITQ